MGVHTSSQWKVESAKVASGTPQTGSLNMRGEIPYSGDDSAGHVVQVATSTSFRTKILCRNFPLGLSANFTPR